MVDKIDDIFELYAQYNTDHNENTQTQIVKKIRSLTAKDDINQKNGNGITLLILAIQNRHNDIANLLIDKSPKVDLIHSAFFRAVKSRQVDIVKYLINNPDLKLQEPLITRAFLGTILKGNLPIAKLLSAKESEIEKREQKSPSTLSNGRKKIVRFITEITSSSKSDPEMINLLPLRSLLQHKHHPYIIGLLLAQGMDINSPNINGDTLLMKAVSESNEETVKFLIKQGADLEMKNEEGSTALLYALKAGNLNMAELLIDERAKFDLQNQKIYTTAIINAALIVALRVGNIDAAIALLDRGAHLIPQHAAIIDTLRQSIDKGNLKTVEFLIDRGVDINLQDEEGQTLLLQAIDNYKINIGIVKFLVERGSNIALQDNDGESAFYALIAVAKISGKSGNIEKLSTCKHIAQLLIVNNMNFFLEEVHGIKAVNLMTTMTLRFNDLAKFLLNNGVDINSRLLPTNMTPAMHAAHNGDKFALAFFLNEGGDINLKDNNDDTALTCSLKHAPCVEITRYLIQSGSSLDGTHGVLSNENASEWLNEPRTYINKVIEFANQIDADQKIDNRHQLAAIALGLAEKMNLDAMDLIPYIQNNLDISRLSFFGNNIQDTLISFVGNIGGSIDIQLVNIIKFSTTCQNIDPRLHKEGAFKTFLTIVQGIGGNIDTKLANITNIAQIFQKIDAPGRDLLYNEGAIKTLLTMTAKACREYKEDSWARQNDISNNQSKYLNKFDKTLTNLLKPELVEQQHDDIVALKSTNKTMMLALADDQNKSSNQSLAIAAISSRNTNVNHFSKLPADMIQQIGSYLSVIPMEDVKSLLGLFQFNGYQPKNNLRLKIQMEKENITEVAQQREASDLELPLDEKSLRSAISNIKEEIQNEESKLPPR